MGTLRLILLLLLQQLYFKHVYGNFGANVGKCFWNEEDANAVEKLKYMLDQSELKEIEVGKEWLPKCEYGGSFAVEESVDYLKIKCGTSLWFFLEKGVIGQKFSEFTSSVIQPCPRCNLTAEEKTELRRIFGDLHDESLTYVNDYWRERDVNARFMQLRCPDGQKYKNDKYFESEIAIICKIDEDGSYDYYVNYDKLNDDKTLADTLSGLQDCRNCTIDDALETQLQRIFNSSGQYELEKTRDPPWHTLEMTCPPNSRYKFDGNHLEKLKIDCFFSHAYEVNFQDVKDSTIESFLENISECKVCSVNESGIADQLSRIFPNQELEDFKWDEGADRFEFRASCPDGKPLEVNNKEVGELAINCLESRYEIRDGESDMTADNLTNALSNINCKGQQTETTQTSETTSNATQSPAQLERENGTTVASEFTNGSSTTDFKTNSSTKSNSSAETTASTETSFPTETNSSAETNSRQTDSTENGTSTDTDVHTENSTVAMEDESSSSPATSPPNTTSPSTELQATTSSTVPPDTPPAASTTEATVIDTPSPPYSETAYSYYSVLQNNMTDTDEINATYVATDAPFGFGYAVKIDRVQKQCLKQTDFPEKARPKCMSNPIKCNDTGLSFSIWEKHTYTQDEFIRSGNNQLKDSDKKYVLSTGGDTMGHPGIAFYHYGIFQYVVVSTGDEYWEVRVPGLMENATWANIGFSWIPTVTENPDGTKSGGLELYINKKLEGRSFYPKATGGAKPGLNPDELMLGCHKTNESSVYRYFGDGEYDELAYWKRALADNETDYFLGGYLEDFSHLTTEEMSEKLANIDMKNPDTLGDALVVVEQMSRQHERPTSAPETTASDIASLASSSPTPAGPNSLQALKEAEDLKRREDLLDILQRMYAEENSADVLTYSQADKLLSGLSAVSNLMSADSASDWKKIQANGSAGSADLMWSSVNFARRTFCSIKYDNNTKPFTVVKGFENLIFYGQKMLYEDLKARGKYVQIPDYGNEKLKPYKTKWNQVFDMGRVMTNVLNDNHCDKRPVCLMTIVFNTYDDIGPTPVNIANIPGDREHEMGARLLYGSLTSDKARDANGKVNYSAPLCQLDKFTMSRNPFYTKLENKVRVPALRQLRFHSDEVVTKVSTRRCAFWNEKLSDFGAWDTDGCQVVDSNEMYTKCTCEKFGSMMVLDEKVQDPAVPPDPSWLNIVKFVLYCISAVVLVFYCIVVAVSSDLKEQFHLMGMYLSISVLIGSISMLVSDLDAIRDSRHLCTTLSTITHYFYVAAGLWVACLGHASFKAITSGEVGGKLNSYSCISWGVAMFSVGVPYAFFVRDLGTDPRCFVTWENNGKAAFFLPQVACVCIAFFFGVVVLFNLSTPALRKENLVEDYGSFCRGAAFVMLYFAITWTFGLLAYMRFGISVDFYPLFQVFNSAMGIIIVIFIGIASYRFRTVLVGKAKSRHEKIKSLAGIKKSKLEEEQPSPKRPRSTKEKSPERPATQSSLHPPQQRGQVAGRPGSRPVTPNE